MAIYLRSTITLYRSVHDASHHTSVEEPNRGSRLATRRFSCVPVSLLATDIFSLNYLLYHRSLSQGTITIQPWCTPRSLTCFSDHPRCRNSRRFLGLQNTTLRPDRNRAVTSRPWILRLLHRFEHDARAHYHFSITPFYHFAVRR